MHIYTLTEAAQRAKLGRETLKRALEAGMVTGVRLPNRQWLVEESALEDALRGGIDLTRLPVRPKTTRPQPEALRAYAATHKRAADATKKPEQRTEPRTA